VHRFDESQVDRVAQMLSAGEVAAVRSQWLTSNRRLSSQARATTAQTREPFTLQLELRRLRLVNRRLSRQLDELKQQLSLLLYESAP
jgi:hypothetical protein